jgi:DNA-binding IclR family transcriptional regulator
MIQETSKEAYNNIPNLGYRQLEVLGQITKGKNWTNTEIAEALGRKINTITPRTKELRDLGFVRESEKRHCHITGKTAIAWELNTN